MRSMLTDSSGSLRYSADLSIDPSAKTVSVQPNPADGLSLETVGYLGQPRGVVHRRVCARSGY